MPRTIEHKDIDYVIELRLTEKGLNSVKRIGRPIPGAFGQVFRDAPTHFMVKLKSSPWRRRVMIDDQGRYRIKLRNRWHTISNFDKLPVERPFSAQWRPGT